MKTSIPPELEPILQKLLGDSYALPLQPHQISILIAKTTGHILSYEQSQWIYRKTEGYFPPLAWVIEILKESPVLPHNPEKIIDSLEKKAFPFFKELIDSKIPPDLKLDLLVLSLLPHEIHPQIPDSLLKPQAIHLLIDALQNTPWLIRESPKTWKFHPLFHDYLKKTARESLPIHEEVCQNLLRTLIAKGYPREAEELLAVLPSKQQGSLLYTLGEALVEKGPQEKALTVFSQAVLAFGQEKDASGIIRSLNAMGALCLELGKKEEAKALYLQLKKELPPEKLQESFIPAYLNLSIPKLHICCLGELKIERGGQLLDWKKWKRRKSLSVFLYLLLQPSHRATKEELLEHFWPNEPPEKASNSYHVTIHALRQSLSAQLDGEVNYLEVERGVLYLRSELISFIDVLEFQKLYRKGQSFWSTQRTQSLSPFWQMKELYQGMLLEGMPYEEWLYPKREALHFQYIDTVTRLAFYYTKEGEKATGLDLWQEILRHDPTNEQAAYHAMTLLQDFNRRNEALSIYNKLALHLEKELDANPDPQTFALYQHISGMKNPSKKR